jgi:ribosome-associated protein
MHLSKLEQTAVDALEDIKARDILILDVRRLTSLYDTMILATADSARQTKALASNVQEKLKAAGGRVIGVEGEQSGEWILVDCGDIVVHVMQPAIRQYYNLEELWSHAPSRRAGQGASFPPAWAPGSTGDEVEVPAPVEQPARRRARAAPSSDGTVGPTRRTAKSGGAKGTGSQEGSPPADTGPASRRRRIPPEPLGDPRAEPKQVGVPARARSRTPASPRRS